MGKLLNHKSTSIALFVFEKKRNQYFNNSALSCGISDQIRLKLACTISFKAGDLKFRKSLQEIKHYLCCQQKSVDPAARIFIKAYEAGRLISILFSNSFEENFSYIL